MSIAEQGVASECFERVYPVLLVDEPALQTPGVNTYLARILRGLVQDHPRVALLTIFTADERELMLPYLAERDVTWKELLDARDTGGEVTAKPASTTFWELVAGRGLRRRSNAVLGPVRNHLSELLRQKYANLKF